MELGSISGNVLNPIVDGTMTPPPLAPAESWECNDAWKEWKNEWDSRWEAGGTGKGAGVYVAHGGIFTKTGGSINGLNTPGSDSQWENPIFQNYYLWPIQDNSGSVGYLPKPDNEVIEGIIGHRGFAIYYDAVTGM
jgi:hypothetical protein